MLNTEKLFEFKKYINTVQAYLNKCFENQSEYLFCKKGCAHCCKRGTYPYSELEFEFLMFGYINLPQNMQLQIRENILSLKIEAKSQLKNDSFYYKCPFLTKEDICALYEYRGIVCRNFGILQIDSNNEVSMPFCETLGLNYSNIYDNNQEKFDYSLVNKLGFKNIPKPFPVSRNLLMDKDMFENMSIVFGETKPLYEWLIKSGF